MKHLQKLVLASPFLQLAACGETPAPSEFTGTVGSSTSIGLRWRKVVGASGYELERRVGSGAFVPLTRQAHEEGGPSHQSYTDTGLTPATRYTYRIRAVNASAQSPWSLSPAPAAATPGLWLGASDPHLYLRTNAGDALPLRRMTGKGTCLMDDAYFCVSVSKLT